MNQKFTFFGGEGGGLMRGLALGGSYLIFCCCNLVFIYSLTIKAKMLLSYYLEGWIGQNQAFVDFPQIYG